jgi:CRISPR-associated protein Csd1
MILKALADLAEAEGLLGDTSYESKEVHYIVHLGPEGKYLGLTAPREEPALGPKGRPIGRPRPPRRPIPKRSERTVQDQAEFLVDKPEYVFGIDPRGERDAAKLDTRRQKFLERVEEAASANSTSKSLRALLNFLNSPTPEDIRAILNPDSAQERVQRAGELFAFVYDPDGGIDCVHDEGSVHRFFSDWLASQDADFIGQCLVTGDSNVALTRLHASPKGIPPVGLTKGGVPLTSVNKESFKSYGLGDIGCAPISKKANAAVEIALTRLLDDRFPGPGGRILSKRSIRLSTDTALVFWSPDGAEVDFLSGVEGSDPEAVREMIHSPIAGRPAAVDDPSRFFALILSGMTGRAIVRSVFESTVAEIASNVDRYFTEAAIRRPYEKGPGLYPLDRMRSSLAAFGEKDRLPPAQSAEVYMAILRGRRFPRSIVEAAVRRNRVELIPETKSGRPNEDALACRCCLIKAWLTRERKENLTVSLDVERRDPPYLLGRLLAAVDKIQGEALGDVNATVVDRYYGSAAATPASVFPTLIRRSQSHLGKLRRDNPGLSVVREKLVQQIASELREFPKFQHLEAQALFALGFYHQRQDFYTKKEKEAVHE